MNNPFKTYRKNKDLSVQDIGLLTGIKSQRIYKAESGMTVTESILNAYESLGFNDVREKWQEYQDLKRKELIKKMDGVKNGKRKQI